MLQDLPASTAVIRESSISEVLVAPKLKTSSVRRHIILLISKAGFPFSKPLPQVVIANIIGIFIYNDFP